MPKWLSMEGNCFTAGGFPSNPIPVRVCAEQKRIYSYQERRQTKVFVPQLSKKQRRSEVFAPQLSMERRRSEVFAPVPRRLFFAAQQRIAIT